jgi:hypothetical protein
MGHNPESGPMRTQGEIEAAISEGISRFEQDYMGRGPKDIHAHLLGDFLVVRLQGVLTTVPAVAARRLRPPRPGFAEFHTAMLASGEQLGSWLAVVGWGELGALVNHLRQHECRSSCEPTDQ